MLSSIGIDFDAKITRAKRGKYTCYNYLGVLEHGMVGRTGYGAVCTKVFTLLMNCIFGAFYQASFGKEKFTVPDIVIFIFLYYIRDLKNVGFNYIIMQIISCLLIYFFCGLSFYHQFCT